MSESDEKPPRSRSLFKYLAAERKNALDGWLRCSPSTVLNDVFEMTTNFTAWSTDEELRALVDQELAAKFDTEMAGVFSKVEQITGLKREQIMSLPGAEQVVKESVQEFNNIKALVKPVLDHHLPALNAGMAKGASSTIGVVSLSEDSTSLLMWAHYADQHMGFVIEYDAEHAWFHRSRGPDDELFHLRQVQYQKERPALIATQSTGVDMFLTKSADWEYEKEWRVVLPLAQCELRGEDNRHVPVHLVQVPRDAIRRVIVGCRMSPEDRRAIVEHPAGFEVCETVPRRDTYGLDLRALPR